MSGYANSVEDKRQPQVDVQLQRLEMNVESAGKQIEELAQRLVPVSRGVSPAPPTGKDKPVAIEALCPMADALRRSNERLDELVSRVTEVRGLLEI